MIGFRYGYSAVLLPEIEAVAESQNSRCCREIIRHGCHDGTASGRALRGYMIRYNGTTLFRVRFHPG